MKTWTLALLAIAASGSFTAQASTETHFTCGSQGHGDAFSVQIGGARFGDEISIGYLEQEIKQLLRANETGLQTSGENIRIVISVGKCTRGTGDVLVTCEQDANDWVLMDYGFTKGEDLGEGFYESSRIIRNARVAAFDLKAIQRGSDAHLDLRMRISTADRADQEFIIQKKLATLNHDWYMCQFVTK